MKKAPKNLLDGQAGVYQVASQLCSRGFNPHFPAVDIGADLVIDAGIRIQVKTTHLKTSTQYPNGVYWFGLHKTVIKKRMQVCENRLFSPDCDFVVLWGIEQNKFWVVPAAVLDSVQVLAIRPDPLFKDCLSVTMRQYENAWEQIQNCFDLVSSDSFIVDKQEKTMNFKFINKEN